MRLLALMYHRARAGSCGNAAEMLDAHFAHIARNYACVLPGEPLAGKRLSVCLTFDDGYFDFHSVVVPMLERHGLRALLAVSPAHIPDAIGMQAAERMAALERQPVQPGGYCSWAEIRDVVARGHVEVAAHGFSHVALEDPAVDLHAEVRVPKTVLAARLGRPVNTFVLPFGRFTPRVLDAVKQSYRYVFRIGGADNRGWDGKLLYRVDADGMDSPTALFTSVNLAKYRVRRFWNTLRRR